MPTTAAQVYTNKKVEPLANFPVVTFYAKLKASTTYPIGCLLGEVTATPGTYAPYASGNADGSQKPSAILPYAVITDASGNITFGTAVGGGEFGQTYLGVDVYVKGAFMAVDLPQSGTGAIDATAVASGSQLVLKQGTIASGQVEII